MTHDKSLNPTTLYLSRDKRKSWIPLHKFVFVRKWIEWERRKGGKEGEKGEEGLWAKQQGPPGI